MKTRYYSEEEIDVIREFAGKKIAEEIGIMLGRTRDSVLNRASRSKICLRLEGENHRGAKLSNLQAQMVKVLFDAGYNSGEIHKACFDHVSPGCIQGITLGNNRTETETQ